MKKPLVIVSGCVAQAEGEEIQLYTSKQKGDEVKRDYTARLTSIEAKLTRIEILLQKLSSTLLDEDEVSDSPKPKRLLRN